MAQKFLHGADVVAIGQEVRGERMPEGVAGNPFGQPSPAHRLRDGLLDERFVNVVASLLAGLGVRLAMLLRKHELPAPLAVRVRILTVQGVW